jgi:hypothetical protein
VPIAQNLSEKRAALDQKPAALARSRTTRCHGGSIPFVQPHHRIPNPSFPGLARGATSVFFLDGRATCLELKYRSKSGLLQADGRPMEYIGRVDIDHFSGLSGEVDHGHIEDQR